MNRRFFHSGLALIVLIGLFLTACGSPAMETQEVSPEANIGPPLPTQELATQAPDPGVAQGGGSGPLPLPKWR